MLINYKVNIRKASVQDLTQLAKLRWDFQLEEQDDNDEFNKNDFIKSCAAFLTEGLESGQWVYWVTEENDEIVAHAFVHTIRMIPKPGGRIEDYFGYLTNVYTIPTFRGKGVGSKMLSHIKQWATSQDLEVLIVWPSENSLSFYKRAGFLAKNEVMELKIRD
ncbi:MAG: hypothetical protein DHS20C18_28770 [Saprospiraceae bacterium]|nr:MAG: hypothetical protein DHS20C18_28770 [Saprospiraceae bacterium]